MPGRKVDFPFKQDQWSVPLWPLTLAFQQRGWKVTIDIRNPAPLLLRHDNVLVAGTNPIRNYLLWLLERIDRLAPIENQGFAGGGNRIEVENIVGRGQLIDHG